MYIYMYIYIYSMQNCTPPCQASLTSCSGLNDNRISTSCCFKQSTKSCFCRFWHALEK